MNKQFVYLNFHTEYSSEGTLEKAMCREYCFSDVFYGKTRQGNTYVIKFYMGECGLNDGQKNNACFLTKEELYDYISLAKNIHDFEFSITEDEDNKNILDVQITLSAKRVVHRYILTWIRYAYEYPFNMYLMDAIRLKKLDEFKDDDLINLIFLVGATGGYHFHGDRIHSIGDICWPRKFYTLEERVQIVKDANDTEEVNSLFPKLSVELNTLYDKCDTFRQNYQSLEYWQSEDYFAQRVPYYKEAKQTIINFK